MSEAPEPYIPLNSQFAKTMGYEFIGREDGRASIAVRVDSAYANRHGIAHGGVLTSLMDTACGTAMGSQPSTGHRGVMTLSLTVNYVAPAHVGDRIIATAQRRGGGQSTQQATVEVHNEAGDLLAFGVATFRLRTNKTPVAKKTA